MAFNKRRPREPRTRANRQIRVPEVRVIDHEGKQLGVMPTEQALAIAEENGYDLVEVSPTARPPVCRIMDFGKFKYEQSKKKRESKKKQHTVQVKEVKFRPKTEEHDYQFKKRHAEEFLEKNHKVKLTVLFRGREMDHKERGVQILQRLVDDLEHLGTVEREAKFEGRTMVMYMAPIPNRQKPTGKKKEDEEETTPEEGNHAETEDESRGEETVS